MMKLTGVFLASVLASVSFSGNASASQYTSRYSDLDLGKCALVEEESEIGFVQVKCAGQYGYDVYVTESDLRLYLAYRKPGEPLSAHDPAGNQLYEMLLGYADTGGDAIPERDVIPESESVENLGSAAEKPGEGIGLIDPETGEWIDIFVPVGVRPIGETVSSFNHLGPKLEWRAGGEEGEPFATIVRYHYQAPDGDGGFENGQVLVVSRFRNGHSCHVAFIDARANADANMMAREVADKFASGGTCPDGAVPVLGRGGEAFRY